MLVLDRPTYGDLIEWLKRKGLVPIPVSDVKSHGVLRQWFVLRPNDPARRVLIQDDGKKLRSYRVKAILEPLALDPEEFWAAHRGKWAGPVAPRDDPSDELEDE